MKNNESLNQQKSLWCNDFADFEERCVNEVLDLLLLSICWLQTEENERSEKLNSPISNLTRKAMSDVENADCRLLWSDRLPQSNKRLSAVVGKQTAVAKPIVDRQSLTKSNENDWSETERLKSSMKRTSKNQNLMKLLLTTTSDIAAINCWQLIDDDRCCYQVAINKMCDDKKMMN